MGVLSFPATPCRAQSNNANNAYTFITIAGATNAGSADGLGTSARFNNPNALAVDANFNIYAADTDNNLIREISTVQTNWQVTTLAGAPNTVYTVDDFSTNGVGPQNPQNDDYFDSSNNYSAGQIINVYTNWFGSAFSNVLFSSSNVDNDPANGSMQVNLDWTPGSQFALHHADYSDNPNVSSLTYTSVEMDVLWDPSSVTATGTVGYATFGPLRLGVRPHAIYNVQDWFYTTNIPSSITNWVHINAPLSAADTNQVNWGELLIGADSSNIGSGLNGPATFYVDNIRFLGPLGTNDSADGTNSAARFNGPAGITVDSSGTLYVADTRNNTIRKLVVIGTNCIVTTIAGLASATNGSANGTNSAARFDDPQGITVNTNGNLFVTDTLNDTIRMLTPVGSNWVVTTIAGSPGILGTNDGSNNLAHFFYPEAIAADTANHLFVADTTNDIIRELTLIGTNCIVKTIAGLAQNPGSADGIGSLARFTDPGGITIDASNNLFVADTGNQTIRELVYDGTNWDVSTIGGVPGIVSHSDGLGTNALFTYPHGICINSLGDLSVDGDAVQAGAIALQVQQGASGQPPEIQVALAPSAAVMAGAAWAVSNSPPNPFYGPKYNNNYWQPVVNPSPFLEFTNLTGWNVPASSSPFLVTNDTFYLITDLSYTVAPPVLTLIQGNGPGNGLWISGALTMTYEIDWTNNLVANPIWPQLPNLSPVTISVQPYQQIANWQTLTQGNAAKSFYRAKWKGN